MDDRSGRGPATGEDPGEGSLAWGWVGSLAVVVLTAAVLVGAAHRTPGTPDCHPYPGSAMLVGCPWVREFVVNAAAILGLLTVTITLGSLLVGVGRLAVRRRDG